MKCKHTNVNWDAIDLNRAIEASAIGANKAIPEVIAVFGECLDCKAEVAMDYVPTLKPKTL